MQLTRNRRYFAAAALATAAALALAGCTSGGGDDADKTDTPAATDTTPAGEETTPAPEDTGAADAGTPVDTDRPMIIFAGSQTPLNVNFNVYSPTVVHAALGGVYETLFYFNKAKDTPPVPMLGESYEWNDTGTELTVKIRSGVKWNDGQDFTTDDVVYSFMNDTNKPTFLKNAEAVDATTVKLTFDDPQYTNEFALMGSTWMIPKHVFEAQDDLLTWTNDKDPVGTGPYMLSGSSDASYDMTANPNYWKEGAPKVKSLKYLAIDSNTSSEDLIKQKQIDWVSLFVGDWQTIVDLGIGYINTPMDPTVLYTCSNTELGCTGAQTDVAVRQALDLALDRSTINERAFMGVAGVISPTFCLLGRDDKWIADGMPKESPQTADAAAAAKVLEDAGYTKGGDGIYAKDGQKVEMSLTSVDGWTDYNSAAQLMAEQALEAGIKINVSTVSWDEFSDSRQTGNYNLIVGGVVGTSTADPFQLYRDWFTTDYTSKVGENVPAGAWNFARYSNAKVDDAVKTAAGTTDEATKKAAYATIQEEITRDLPYIPVVINGTQTFFNQVDYTGWPTEDNLYAFPPAWGSVSLGVILDTIGGAQ